MTSKVLPFAHTEYTWKRKIHRECKTKAEQEYISKAGWFFQWEDSLKAEKEKGEK